MSASVRISGKIKFFKEDKGYGFIVRDDGRGDIFFHKVDCPRLPDLDRRLSVGASLSFEIEDGRGNKGPRAVNLEFH